MTVRSLWFSIPKSFRLPLVAALGIFLLLYSWNFWRYKTVKPGNYLPSEIVFAEAPREYQSGQAVRLVWQISAPTPRNAQQTALYWGTVSTSSADLADPKDLPYPSHTPDYLAGPFSLPEDFSASLNLEGDNIIYVRAYALVDNQHLWSEEIKLKPKKR